MTHVWMRLQITSIYLPIILICWSGNDYIPQCSKCKLQVPIMPCRNIRTLPIVCFPKKGWVCEWSLARHNQLCKMQLRLHNAKEEYILQLWSPSCYSSTNEGMTSPDRLSLRGIQTRCPYWWDLPPENDSYSFERLFLDPTLMINLAWTPATSLSTL